MFIHLEFNQMKLKQVIDNVFLNLNSLNNYYFFLCKDYKKFLVHKYIYVLLIINFLSFFLRIINLLFKL